MDSLSDAWTELHLDNLIVAGNDGAFAGGANLYTKNGSVRIAGSLFDANRASTTSSAQLAISTNAHADAAQNVVIANSTFVRGRCAQVGGRGCGVRVGLVTGAHLDILNSVFFDNTGSDLDIEGSPELGDGSASADSSLVEHVGGSLPLDAQNALEGDPRFVDAANGNFRLRDDSPFINLGLAPVPDYPFASIDLDGSLRTRFDAADPGAYENQTWDFLFADGFEH